MIRQQQEMQENTSGMGDASVIPPGVKGWSWGAFCLSWIWGIGNSVFIALLFFVPIVNIVMLFVLGFKGREWAWRKRRWLSVEEFRRVQRRWSIAGLLLWGAMIVLLPTTLYFSFSTQRELAVTLARQNSAAVQLLGAPIKAGWFAQGKVSNSPSGSCAIVWVPVSGSKASGSMFMVSVGEGESWLVLRAILIGEDQKLIMVDRPSNDQYNAQLEACRK